MLERPVEIFGIMIAAASSENAGRLDVRPVCNNASVDILGLWYCKVEVCTIRVGRSD